MKYKYHCWNWSCRAYCGTGHMIKSGKRLEKCPHCGHNSLEDCSSDASPWVYVLSAVIAGWFMGFIVNGWLGSFVGLAAGLVLGQIVYIFTKEENIPPGKQK
ncbi:MAG: hypothetical protein GF375_05015 [Candidatus Omnitrophica bacterium]|nr:hypothetical protein [Candidatus Omnitrophota bacterium]